MKKYVDQFWFPHKGRLDFCGFYYELHRLKTLHYFHSCTKFRHNLPHTHTNIHPGNFSKPLFALKISIFFHETKVSFVRNQTNKMFIPDSIHWKAIKHITKLLYQAHLFLSANERPHQLNTIQIQNKLLLVVFHIFLFPCGCLFSHAFFTFLHYGFRR